MTPSPGTGNDRSAKTRGNVAGRGRRGPHYSGPMSLLVDSWAWVRRDAGVVVVRGPDRLAFLHNLLSQEFEEAAEGTAADFLFLDVKGNARAAGRAVVRADDVLLVVPERVADELARVLASSTFLMQAKIERLAGWELRSVRGPGASPALGIVAEGLPEAVDGAVLPAVTSGKGVVVRDRSGGLDLVGPGVWLDGLLAGSDLPEAKAGDWEHWRILHGEPSWDAEIVAGRRAQELGLLPTHVHMRKGCYPGQESIAKIYNLGRPRRALVVVELDEPVATGDELGTDLGTGVVTSAVTTASGGLALALVPLDGDGKPPARTERPTGAVLRRVGEGLPQPGA